MKIFITILRWIARIISVLAVLLFTILFFQDGLPLYLFTSGDTPENIFHMWALLAMLIGLGLGWKWEGLSAALVLGFFTADILLLSVTSALQSGLEFGLLMAASALSFPFAIIPLCGLFYLMCWAWGKYVSAKVPATPSITD
jgi:hypothetical protein